MPPAPNSDRSPKEQRGITPTLFYTVLVLIVLAIAAFLLLRPGGKGTGTSSPAATQH